MARIWQAARDSLARFWDTRVHFIELHYFYIGFLIFVASGLYYCQPGTHWNYVDALFMATTGSTNTGLNTIAMSEMSTYQMLVLFFCSFFSSHVLISYIVLIVRKHYFSKRFEDILLFNKARRIREESRCKERLQQKKLGDDLELGLKRRKTIQSVSTATSPNQSRRRCMSFSSTVSTPVPGAVKDRKPRRRRSMSMWMTSPSEIREYFRQLREEQNALWDKREAEALAAAAAGTDHRIDALSLDKQTSQHPFDTGLQRRQHRATDDDLQRVASTPSAIADGTSGNPTTTTTAAAEEAFMEENAGTQGIAFAGNVEQQRELARRRLEQERRFEELMQKIAGDPHHAMTDTLLNSDDDDDEDYDEAEFEEIMRQPIDKRQLTRQQRYRIGGAEYRALDMLSHLVPCYYIGIVVVAAFLLRIYVACSSYAQKVLATSNTNGPVEPWFFCFFVGLSGFNNLGLMNLDASMVPFKNAPVPLLICIFLILAGNTAYAILLRFIIWCMYKLTPHSQTMRRETLRYLLDHPRRCYTTLFPSTQTWWLLIILICITALELVCFLALNFWLPVTEDLTWGSRVLDGLFQSVATRNAGFSVLSLGDLNPGTQIIYIVAMYISVYPVAISMRNSNVYQERALGIYRGNELEDVKFSESDLRGPAPFMRLRRHPTINSVMTTSRKFLRGPDFFVLTQIQRQLTSDICWVISGIFAICVIESQNIMSPSPITMATVIYECVSAFGNVGASTGYPNTSTSQAAQYHTLSKLVLILLMYRGRHRGLPSAIDRAVLLPSEQLEEREIEEQVFKRRNTSFTTQQQQQAPPNYLFYTRSSTL